MKRLGGVLFTIVLLLIVGCQQGPQSTAASPAGGVPAELAKGEALFNSHCAKCHGQGAVGTDRGPSFLNKIYEPNHHGDAAFHLAARGGVRAHHWQFGNMPPVEGVGEADVDEIVRYVRWLQRQAGIF